MNDQCPLSDEQIDAVMAEFFPRTKSSPGYRGFARAVATTAVEAERQRREGEDFENSLEAHHRAELGLRPKLPKGHHYYVAHPLAQVEIRKDSAIPEDRAALTPLGAQAVPISILELMDEVRGLAAQWVGDEVNLACAPSEDASARAQNSHDIFNAAVARLASMSTGTTSPSQIAEDRAAQQRAEAAEAEAKMLRGFSELWYFVMDEQPMEFERIVTTCVPKMWMDEAQKLRSATQDPVCTALRAIGEVGGESS